MRSVVALLFLSWLTGIFLGLAHASAALLALASAVFLAAALMTRSSAALKLAVILVMLLGSVYGRQSLPQSECKPNHLSKNVIAQVAEAVIQAGGTRYVIKDASNCSYLIYADSYPVFRIGQAVAISGGQIQPVADMIAAPEREGFLAYLRDQNIDALWWRPAIEARGRPPEWPDFRRHMASAISKVFREPDASLVNAMLLAERGTLPERLSMQFRATGVSHIIAISGLNITILAGSIYAFLLLWPIRPSWRIALALLMLWSYVIVIGAPSSAARAASFWTLALFGFSLKRLTNLPTILMLSAAVMGTTNPGAVLDVGWQLSFAAVIGIFLAVFIAPTERLWRLPPWLKPPVSAMIISAGATLATWPLVVFYFGTFATVSIAANLLIVSAVPLLMFMSLLTLGVAVLNTAASLILAFIVHMLIIYMDLATRYLAQAPFAFIQNLSISPRQIFAYYLALLCLFILYLKVARRSWREIWV